MSKKRRTRDAQITAEEEHELNQLDSKSDDRKLTAKTEAQGHYLLGIQSSIITFGIGPAGTGKTYIATCMAADAIRAKQVSKILITRPAVEAGEELGFLPGTLEEKFDPYFRPVRDILAKRLGPAKFEYMVKHKQIEALPLAYMRGHTFDNCFVLFDEAQNASVAQMKLFLTRIGNYSKVVINGDLRQRDLPDARGLEDAIARLQDINGVSVVEFTREDIVRSGIAQKIVEAYES